jgi:hypothetical protein
MDARLKHTLKKCEIFNRKDSLTLRKKMFEIKND